MVPARLAVDSGREVFLISECLALVGIDITNNSLFASSAIIAIPSSDSSERFFFRKISSSDHHKEYESCLPESRKLVNMRYTGSKLQKRKGNENG